MDNQLFILKRSYLALAFQALVFLIIALLLFQLMDLLIWGICIVASLAIYLCGLRFSPNLYFQHLDEREWTLKQAAQTEVQHLKISHVIDHHVYIVVYFQHFKQKPLLIWCDQVAWKDWKKLKMLAKML
jgi:hypothetical protein